MGKHVLAGERKREREREREREFAFVKLGLYLGLKKDQEPFQTNQSTCQSSEDWHPFLFFSSPAAPPASAAANLFSVYKFAYSEHFI